MIYYVLAILGVALIFDFSNGFHDSANSIATIVGTRVLSPLAAVIWAAFFNFTAAFTAGELVAKAIQKDIIRTDIVTPNLILAGLLGALIWNIITWYYGIPSSSSHALIGGYAGAGVAKMGFAAITWGAKWIQTLSFIVAIAGCIGLPIGIGAGLFLAESRNVRASSVVRFLSDVLNGLPSIVVGIFAWEFLVRPVGHFSALAGGAALGAMMIPLVTRTTEEMLRTVPVSLREAALALGYPRWRTSLAIVLRTAAAGIVTGSLVALARVAGETAPLLFTALGNQFWSVSFVQPIAALPLQIFAYAISPYDEWHAKAWAGALVLMSIIFIISLIARIFTRSRFGSAVD